MPTKPISMRIDAATEVWPGLTQAPPFDGR
jgi:hypothetical protein